MAGRPRYETVIVKVAVADCFGELLSVTFTVNVSLTAEAFGLPVIFPSECRCRPFGRLPVFVHLYGVVPPAALSVAVYATPFVAPGRDVVVTCRALLGTTVSTNDWVLMSPLASVAEMVTGNWPETYPGVPDNIPELDSVTPDGQPAVGGAKVTLSPCACTWNDPYTPSVKVVAAAL